jgi:hypothetical protein
MTCPFNTSSGDAWRSHARIQPTDLKLCCTDIGVTAYHHSRLLLAHLLGIRTYLKPNGNQQYRSVFGWLIGTYESYGHTGGLVLARLT